MSSFPSFKYNRTYRSIDMPVQVYDGYDSKNNEVNLNKLQVSLHAKLSPLNQGEKDLLKILDLFSVVMPENRWKKVRVRFSSGKIKAEKSSIFRPNAALRSVIRCNANFIDIFTLAHELVHIWQQGTSSWSYLSWLIKIVSTETVPHEAFRLVGKPEWYDVYSTAEKDIGKKKFKELKYEQQASVIEYWFRTTDDPEMERWYKNKIKGTPRLEAFAIDLFGDANV